MISVNRKEGEFDMLKLFRRLTEIYAYIKNVYVPKGHTRSRLAKQVLLRKVTSHFPSCHFRTDWSDEDWNS